MTLLQKQQLFAHLIATFVLRLNASAYEVTEGESWRPDAMAELYAKSGKGIRNSLHRLRLAKDLNIFDRTGKLLTTVDEIRPWGEIWKSLGAAHGVRCCWGGDFMAPDPDAPHLLVPKPDADHFSIEHDGVR